VELMLAAEVDPYFRATVLVAVFSDGAEIEEATIETLGPARGADPQGRKILQRLWDHQ
jgi:hypothetical protein